MCIYIHITAKIRFFLIDYINDSSSFNPFFIHIIDSYQLRIVFPRFRSEWCSLGRLNFQAWRSVRVVFEFGRRRHPDASSRYPDSQFLHPDASSSIRILLVIPVLRFYKSMLFQQVSSFIRMVPLELDF